MTSPTKASMAVRPRLALLGTEPWRAAGEFISHKIRRSPVSPCGDGHPAILFPGLASDGHALAPLRQHCRKLGNAAVDWGRGWNTGPEGDVDRCSTHTPQTSRSS